MVQNVKHFKIVLAIPLAVTIAILFAACGGSRNGGSAQSLESVVKKLNAQYSQVGADSDDSGTMEVTLDGKRILCVVRYNREGAPVVAGKFEEKLRPTNLIPSLPVEFFTIWTSDEQQKVDVPGRDVLALLIEKDVDVVIQEKNKNGTVLAEAVLDVEKMKERIRNWENREKENEIIRAEIELSSFTDSRDGHIYKTGTVVGETWIAEDIVYENKTLFTWDEAKKICPEGWRLPTAEELCGLRFLKFRWKYIDYNQQPIFWSMSTKNGLFGEEVVAIQPKDDGFAEVGVPVNLSNSFDKKHHVRCILRE